MNVTGIVPGYHHIKIKEAYGLTKADAEQKLADDGVSDQAVLETQGREAGRKATLAVVRALTGVPIDYFAEVNLAGFYDVAASLGGVEVCLNHAVHDDYSGADFPAGRQTLDARQALAFVRQRHGLDNGDLDRTHRQQAFLISVIRQLQDSGSFTDVGKLNGLMDVARKDIVLSSGWNEDLFRRIGELAGGQVQYQTLPVLRYDTVDGQDVNIVDPARSVPSSPPPSVTRRRPPRRPCPPPTSPSTSSTPAAFAAWRPRRRTARATTVIRAGRAQPCRCRGRCRPARSNTAPAVTAPLNPSPPCSASCAPPQPRPDVAPAHVRVVLGDGYVLPADVASLAMAPSGGESLGIGLGDNDYPAPDQGAPDQRQRHPLRQLALSFDRRPHPRLRR